ncbi:MAG: isoprenyl transferase [Salibacteraceae bacterium]
MTLRERLDPNRIPRHVAIIMDGNGRWAKKKGHTRIFGHRNAIKAVRDTVEGAAEIGVEYVTLYAFSTENWNRPKVEVNALMELLVNSINREIKTLNQNDIRLLAIGNLDSLPSRCVEELETGIIKTANNQRMTLVLALSYSSRWEIIRAVKKMVNEAKDGKITEDDIDQELFRSYLETSPFPDPELMIRTSGEYRISNFLLWQLAYAELAFLEKFWPDFRKEDLFRCILDYQGRERRFGKTGEQIKSLAK